MSWQMVADIREMFVEMALTDGQKLFCSRNVNRKDQLASGLIESINSLPEPWNQKENIQETKLFITTDFNDKPLPADGPAYAGAVEGDKLAPKSSGKK